MDFGFFKVFKTSLILNIHIPCLVWLMIVELGLDFVFIKPVYKNRIRKNAKNHEKTAIFHDF